MIKKLIYYTTVIFLIVTAICFWVKAPFLSKEITLLPKIDSFQLEKQSLDSIIDHNDSILHKQDTVIKRIGRKIKKSKDCYCIASGYFDHKYIIDHRDSILTHIEWDSVKFNAIIWDTLNKN